jgi:predicted TIM-barrel fold metal-dependent hydrolase
MPVGGAIEAMNRAGVRAALVVIDQEVEEFFRVRARHPSRLYGWAHYDSLQPERGLVAVRALCEGHAEAFVGVATAFPCFGQDPRWKAFVPFYEYCMQRGLPVLFRSGGGPHTRASARPLAVGVLATVYPRLRIVCLREDADEGDEIAGLLARLPNLFLAANPGPVRDDSPDMRTRVRTVGSRKIMFASGGRETGVPYDRSVAALSRLAWWHRANIGWRTATRVFGPRIWES